MPLSIDLHIHSLLSPCADDEMTPNNIVNMAIIKGLDVISVTDHNSTVNLPFVQKVATELGIAFIPGIEVQTKEEVHMLCYFKTVESALAFGNIIYSKLPDINNNCRLFGNQLIMDSNDNIIGHINKLLLSSADISLGELVILVAKFDGIYVPAHVDRNSYSIISNLGFISSNLSIKTVEISRYETVQSAIKKFPFLDKLNILRSSDAHYLQDIFERESFLPFDEFTTTSLFNYIRNFNNPL